MTRSPATKPHESLRQTESGLKGAVEQFLALYPRRLKFYRQNTGVFLSLDGQRHVRAGSIGCADFTGWIVGNGRRLEIELKTERGKLRPAQVVFRDTATADGVLYLVVRSVDEMQAALRREGIIP